MPSLTIFANFYIDSEERFLRMKDSFASILPIGATKWVVNTRGAFREQTNSFLREQLGDTLTLFTLESRQGWFNDTKQMLYAIDTDFVFFWVEDHLNVVSDPAHYATLLTEMKQTGSDYLQYSWWHAGAFARNYASIPKQDRQTISSFTLTKMAFQAIHEKSPSYVISMVGIFSQSLFKKIILTTPQFLRQHPKQTPFNFERGGEYTDLLPLRMALPTHELFAPIDDDNGEPGYSLQSRGLYPIRERRAVPPQPAYPKQPNIFKKTLPKALYAKLIKIVIFANKCRRYVYLVRHGQ